MEHRRSRKLSASVFQVKSRDGKLDHLIVLLPDGNLHCDCKASLESDQSLTCWHKKKIALRLLRNKKEILEAIS